MKLAVNNKNRRNQSKLVTIKNKKHSVDRIMKYFYSRLFQRKLSFVR